MSEMSSSLSAAARSSLFANTLAGGEGEGGGGEGEGGGGDGERSGGGGEVGRGDGGARAIASGGEGRGALPRAADVQLVGVGQGCVLPSRMEGIRCGCSLPEAAESADDRGARSAQGPGEGAAVD
eukprot:scaffold78323_cov43-Phaeocystis_antarctica.AAC.3